MRHRVYGKHLGRDKNQRAALFKSLIGSLILNGSIQTTESKAKAIKGLVDKIITQAKSKTTQRLVSSYLVQKKVQDRLFKEVVPAVKERTSGYTSIVKMGRRLGDGAMEVKMSIIGVEVLEGVKTNKKEEKKVEKKEDTKAEETKEVEAKVEDEKLEKTAVKPTPVKRTTGNMSKRSAKK